MIFNRVFQFGQRGISNSTKLVPVAYEVAARISCIQLVSSRWGIESYVNTVRKENGSLPKSIAETLETGRASIEECSTLDELSGYFSSREVELIRRRLGDWKESEDLMEMESIWESLATLLWSLRVIDKLPKCTEWSMRQETYALTGIKPSKVSSIMYWIRGFQIPDEELTSKDRNLRDFADVYHEYRKAAAWRWRCFMWDLENIDAVDRDKRIAGTRSLLKNIPKGIESAAIRCLDDKLVEMTLDNDFVIHENNGFTKFKDCDAVTVDRVRRVSTGRLLAFQWLLSKKIDPSLMEGMDGVSLGVDAIWKPMLLSDTENNDEHLRK